MAKRRAWDDLQSQGVDDALATRDVHSNQQIKRSHIEAPKKAWPWKTAAVVFGVLVAILAWVVFSGGSFVVDKALSMLNKTWKVSNDSLMGYLLSFAWWKLGGAALLGLLVWSLLRVFFMRNLYGQNRMNDTTDINQYEGDQHIALPEEVQRRFDIVPDVGAHTSVSATSLISHSMLSTKGLKKVECARFADKDIVDKEGNIIYHKGEMLCDANGQPITDMKPIIDEDFGEALWDASNLVDDKSVRQRLVAGDVPYNADGKNRDKLPGYKNIAEVINKDWEYPLYEPQRPAGIYFVDTGPANTMMLAMTRAGKGQGYIEPMIDIWSREKIPQNMLINDPKGELLVKNYVRLAVRGFQVVQFNLINSMKTDIYNPLGMAAEAAREGDQTKCALYVENIADVFFPVDGAEDPVWPNAANNAFKRAAYGLIDYYLEEEREMRLEAVRNDTDPKVLAQRLDEMWGKVTLYNCYQLFVQMTSKKVKNPVAQVEAKNKAGEFNDNPEEYERQLMLARRAEFLWEDKPEADMLTLYFNACDALPQNTMRTLIANANNALRAMAGAEKMLASVYGIAITAMSFFTDPTISTLTSGTPSQNTDLGGLSFPRRIGVRFAQNFLKRDNLIGKQVVWEAFSDPMFTENLGKDFYHEDLLVREGWARYYFKGIFPSDVAYIRLRIQNAQTGAAVRTLYFKFVKNYQTSLNGRRFVKDPILEEKIVNNGVLIELVPVEDKEGNVVAYEHGFSTYADTKLVSEGSGPFKPRKYRNNVIMADSVRYSEKPKAVFLVTPPHLMKYAKLILILLTQLVNLNFDKSYMTKADQKPLYKTRFMLDEFWLAV